MTFADESLMYTEQDDKDNADAVYQVSISANRKLYEQLRRSDPEVCPALRELMKEDIAAEIQAATKAAAETATQVGRNEGFTLAIIGLVKDGLLPIETGADRMHITVDEMKKLVLQN